MTFRFQRAVIELSMRKLRWTEIHARRRHKQTGGAKDTLERLIGRKEQEDALFSPSLAREHRSEIKLPE